METVYNFLWWLIGTSIWTWVIIALIIMLLLLVLASWCALLQGKEYDEKSQDLYKKMVEEKEVKHDKQSLYS